VKFTYAVITELREKLDAGATADVLVLPTPVLDGLAKDGKMRADSRATFGAVGISAVVKEGAPRPDISSNEKFRTAMLAARSVVHATPGKTPSGTHMGKVMDQLDISDAMAKKVILKPALAEAGTPSTHPIVGDELRALRRLQREQEPKSPFVFTSERGALSRPRVSPG